MNEEQIQIMKKFRCWSYLDGNKVHCPNDPRKGAENSIHSSLKPTMIDDKFVFACDDCGFITEDIPQEVIDADGSRFEQMIKDINDKATRIILGTEPTQKPIFTDEQRKKVRDKILNHKTK